MTADAPLPPEPARPAGNEQEMNTIKRGGAAHLPTLFDAPAIPPYQRRSLTSKAAALDALRDGSRGANLRRVPRRLAAAGAGGMIDLELKAELGMSGDSERPARVALVRASRVVASDATRTTKAGRRACVWIWIGGAVEQAQASPAVSSGGEGGGGE
ncbi:MAG: hypothetical protein WD042_03480 [Phycisphaeraceae bacterium]